MSQRGVASLSFRDNEIKSSIHEFNSSVLSTYFLCLARPLSTYLFKVGKGLVFLLLKVKAMFFVPLVVNVNLSKL